MGNKSSQYEGKVRNSIYFSSQASHLQSRGSEESYLPMSSAMRKSLLENMRFRHVLPTKEEEVKSLRTGHEEVRDDEEQKSEKELIEYEEEPDKECKNKSDLELAKDLEDIKKLTSSEESVKVKFQSEPIVTILKTENDLKQSLSFVNYLGVETSFNEGQDKTGKLKVFPKSPNTTNRKYSLMDMRTGLKKSKFTLELEERLRQSKLELGFDADLNDLKEYSYKIDTCEIKNKEDSPRTENVKNCSDLRVGQGLGKVCLKEPLQYCARNCQILGLCSVRRPELYPNKTSFAPPIFNDEITRKYEVDNIISSIGNVKHPHKRDDCNCELCMLAYLTEMSPPDVHESRSTDIKKKRIPTISSSSCRRTSGGKQRLRLVESGSREKTIDVSSKCPSTISRPTAFLDTTSKSTISTRSLDVDCTNRKIKRMFKRHNPKRKVVDRNIKKIQQEQTKVDLSSERPVSKSDKSLTEVPKEMFLIQAAECERKTTTTTRRIVRGGIQYLPPSTSNTSARSSLSSILSYKRVRQIFQTIIERNRIKKRRVRRNIHKFKEMEDLGLGEVKNNRWYPSDSKTVSIWNGINSSVQGVQAEFKKYPKTTTKLLNVG